MLRFQNSLSLSFPASQIEALWVEPSTRATDVELMQATRDEQGAQIFLTPSFMGLLSVDGAMPLHHKEGLGASQRTDRDSGASARAFIDLFSQRMLSMFFQAWGKYRLEHQLDMGRAKMPNCRC